MHDYKTLLRRAGAVLFWLAVWQAAAMAIGQEVFLVSPGIAIGVISWTIINVVTGKAKEKKISPLMYVLTVLFILKYICL